MKSVACLGECMIELVERPDGALTRGFGGDTLNTAIYFARLGVPTEYVTALGDDSFSDEMLRAWREEGVGTEAVLRLPGRVPGLYLIQTDSRGERRFSYWRDSAPVRQLFRVPETPAIERALAGMEMVYLSGITLSLFDDESRARLFVVLDRTREAGGKVAFDTNFRPRGWPDREKARKVYDEMAARSDVVLSSVEDHSLLYGEAEDSEVIAHLRRAAVPEIVVKLPRPCCRVVAGEEEVIVEAGPVSSVVDTTAAGDSFAAGYLAARRAGAGPAAAARAGHRVAGTVVQHRGAIIPRSAMPVIDLIGAAS